MGPLLNEQLCFALYRTTGEITKAYRQLLDPHQLTYPQFVILMALWHEDGASPTNLANRVGLSKGTVTPVLKKLEESNFIRRQQVPGNDRAKSMNLTTKGRSFAIEGQKISQKAFCATGLSQNEANTIIQLCSKIRFNLGKDV